MLLRILLFVVLILGAPTAEELLSGDEANGWRVSLEQRVGYPCSRVHAGQRYVYLLIACPPRHWNAHPLVVPDQRPVLNETDSRYDVDTFITCLDGYTGKLLWTRRLAGWNFGVALDESDDLFAWRKAIFRFAAETGELKEQRPLPAGERVEALWLNGQISFERLGAAAQGSSDNITAYNWTTKRVISFPAQRTFFMAPDESVYLKRRYADNQTILSAYSVADDHLAWQFRSSGAAMNDPIWEGPDVIYLTGGRILGGHLLRLDGGTGQVKWRANVPGKSFYPPANSITGAGYLPSDINGLVRWKNSVAALSRDGRLLMFDPENGKLLQQIPLGSPLLGFPRMIKDRLIFATPTAVTADPLKGN